MQGETLTWGHPTGIESRSKKHECPEMQVVQPCQVRRVRNTAMKMKTKTPCTQFLNRD